MPIAGLTTITVTGTYESMTGAGQSGTVTFTPTSTLIDAAGKIIIPAVPIVAGVAGGTFSVTLPTTDNIGLTPSSWGWIISVGVPGIAGVQSQFTALLPSSLGTTVDISALTPVAGSFPITSSTLSSSNTWTGNQTFNGQVSADGGFNTGVRVLTSSGALDGSESTAFINGPGLTVTLPDARVTPGKMLTVKLVYPFTTATCAAIDGQDIDGYPSYQMATQYQWVTMQSDGSNWQVVSAKPGGLLTIPVASLPSGSVNVPYSFEMTASGGWPGYTWSVKSGSLPTGVSLSSSGAFSGIPSIANTTGFTIQVTDSVGNTATASLAITVGGGVVIVQSGSLSNASSGASVTPSFAVSTTAGNLLIAHLGCNGSGPPVTAASGWVITLGGGSGNWHCVAYKLNCSASETAPTFSCPGTSDMWAYLEEWSGVATSSALDQTATSSAGSPSWTATFGSLDTVGGELLVSSAYWNGSNTGGTVSLSSFISSTGGTITGTFLQGANAFGQYFAGVSGVNGPTGSTANQVSMNLSVFAGGDGILVSFKPGNAAPPGSPSVTTSSPLPGGSTQQPYTTTLAAEGGVPPYTWTVSAGTLPNGLGISAGGIISGTPTVAVNASFTVKVTDSQSNSGTAPMMLDIAQTPAVTFTTTLPQGTSQLYTVSSIVGTTTGVNVNNNVWNPVTGWQSTLSVVDPTDWWVVANFPAGNTAVSSYPSLDCVFSDLPLSGFSSIVSSFSEQMNPNPGTQSWGAYDIWCNNWANEIMIHHDLARFNPYDNTPVARGISFGGSHGVPVLSFDLHLYGAAEYVWQPASGTWNEQSGSFDILQMLTWMVTNGFLPAVNTLTAIGYGWEICSTGGVNEFYKVSSFTMTATYG